MAGFAAIRVWNARVAKMCSIGSGRVGFRPSRISASSNEAVLVSFLEDHEGSDEK